jgi:hypothetical protein
MSGSFIRELKVLLVATTIVAVSANADELNVASPQAAQSSAEITDKDAIKSRSSGGRVIEYRGEVETNSGVVQANVRQDPTKTNVDTPTKSHERNINQQNSVKLITGGDPSDGNAKSGQLPVLD